MPRFTFTLRRLLLTAAIVPPLIAAVWYCFDLGRVHAGSDENKARTKLLAYTPPGTSAQDVLKFVADDLHHAGGGQGSAYYRYLQNYRASTGKDVNLTPTENQTTGERTIEVIVSSMPAGFMMAHEVTAIWHFDRQDRLIDITTNSYGIGP
jgi:hypothetical protein